MARRKNKKATGIGVNAPPPRVKAESVAAPDGAPLMTAQQAFKAARTRGSASAFSAWLREVKGIPSGTKKTSAEWLAFLPEFQNRTVHGHRRGPSGGSHRRS